MYEHVPVMLSEVVSYLQARPGDLIIDGTLGGAGYTVALAQAVGPKGKILSIDLDDLALNNAKLVLKEKALKNVHLVQDNFKNIRDLAGKIFGEGVKVQGIVVDLGLSSAQLADENRGFSFQGDRPLSMAFGKDALDTVNIINHYPLLELTRIFREYGEDRFAYQIAKKIVSARRDKKISNTEELRELIMSSVPGRFRHQAIHPATRIFQALRMETNQELSALKQFLPAAIELLAPGGRLVVVSFHSGEDRIVKNFFRDHSKDELLILTKKPLVPTLVEIQTNPRSRSAKMRVVSRR